MTAVVLHLVTGLIWSAVIVLAGVIVVDVVRDWWDVRQRMRRMDRADRPDTHPNCRCTILQVFSRGSNTPGQVTIETPPPPAAPVAFTVTADTSAFTEAMTAAGVRMDEITAGTARLNAAMACATEGHRWNRLAERCAPEWDDWICLRCGNRPSDTMPRLWEGDQA